MVKKLIVAPEADWEQDGVDPEVYHLQTTDNVILHPVSGEFTVPGTWRAMPASTTADTTTIGDGRTVFAIVGQSENVISLTARGSGYAQQPFPTLLAGVDCILVRSGHNSADGEPEIVTVNQSAIDAKEVTPGLVAWANMMHIVSGGKPQCLVDMSDGGTGMEGMMDGDSNNRPTEKDLATVALARANNLDPQIAVYCWSNSEAAASQNLIRDRNPHFLGINSDGSPYDFDTGNLEYCLVDTTDRGYGMLSRTCKISLMLVHHRVIDVVSEVNPPNRNYRSDADGTRIYGMVHSNSYPAIQSRKDFLAQPYLDGIRGKVGVAQSVCRFGDYSGGVKAAGGQSAIHPSVHESDGQILYAQHVAAHMAYVMGWMEIPSAMNMVNSSDGKTITGTVNLPVGTTLTTIREIRGETISPIPAQYQPVMGMAIRRAEGVPYHPTITVVNNYPVFRVGEGPSADYEGTVVITDANAGVVVTTLTNPLEDGDEVWHGGSGQYAEFSLNGYPDYDARMYKDCLVAHDPVLYAATGYPGVPVEPQGFLIVSGVTETPEPNDWDVVGGVNKFTINSMPDIAAPIAVGGVNKFTVTG